MQIMEPYYWQKGLQEIYDRTVKSYRGGVREQAVLFGGADRVALAKIGLKPIQVFDAVEDFCNGSEPDWESFLLMASVRRDYFLTVQRGVAEAKEIQSGELPLRSDELDGIPWLPRLLAKARAFLRGTLSRDIMYCCGGDRKFLKRHNVHPSDFLRVVWAAKNEDTQVLEFLRRPDRGNAK